MRRAKFAWDAGSSAGILQISLNLHFVSCGCGATTLNSSVVNGLELPFRIMKRAWLAVFMFTILLERGVATAVVMNQLPKRSLRQ